MSKLDIFDTIAALRQTGAPFCVATVVRTADVTSAKAGAKAAITNDGEIMGHLGGGCVTRAVREAAFEAIATGATTVIRVKPSAKVVALTDEDGAQVFRSGCPSGGTVDLLIEPYELPPMLALFGTTPIARAIAQHAALAGLRVACDPALELSETQAVDRELTQMRPQDFVVIATQGAGDLDALKSALSSPVRRVSMIASARKAAALVAKLDTPPLAGRLKSPAGLDLGGIDPHDIALSVLAEIVQWRNSDPHTLEETDETTA
ncbi:xanthine dehydrogenase accessory factor [Sagittula marina]|uniref:Xanthine dehydrogenase accessory factor n=1 Tax=Sagittula marina TaxID=943940 RepID=A0A7W6DMN3_9RHOB|nr:XdhC family protein [Sagittula marina]MBB3985941.1 xanthine dehydrogenase accessory factor [Sagittula marina]